VYEIILTDQAIKDLKSINASEKPRIASKLQQYARDLNKMPASWLIPV